jgi:hypothetical protein
MRGSPLTLVLATTSALMRTLSAINPLQRFGVAPKYAVGDLLPNARLYRCISLRPSTIQKAGAKSAPAMMPDFGSMSTTFG